MKLERDGSVTVLIGSQSTGQGHATAYAQIVAENLGLPPERVVVVQGDTDRIASGLGTGGSSSIPCGGASLDGAARKARRKNQNFCRRGFGSERGRSRNNRRRRGAHCRHRPGDLVRGAGAASGCGRNALPLPMRSPRRRRPTRTARISPRSRSIRRRERRGSSITSWSTISAKHSIRCCSPAKSMAAPRRGSARR